MTPELLTMGRYLAGEFENRQQAIAEPAWYVHLHLWLRPVPLFIEDSLTLYAEQASIISLDRPYRPRLLRLRQCQEKPTAIAVQHYMFKDIQTIQGAGRQPKRLEQLTLDQVELLTTSGCTLQVKVEQPSSNSYHFQAFSPSDSPCCFTYQGQTYQVSLGFEVNAEELKTYDKGIDATTGKAVWGALMGPYCFKKCLDFSHELPV